MLSGAEEELNSGSMDDCNEEPTNGPDNEEAKSVKLCNEEPKLKPNNCEGAVEELSDGKLEDNNGKPIEDDSGDNDNGPSNDNEEDGIIDGADNKYHNGNELEAKGAPEDDDNDSADGINEDDSSGKELDNDSQYGNKDDGPKLLAGLDKDIKGSDELDSNGVTIDCDEESNGPLLIDNGISVKLCNKEPKLKPDNCEGAVDELNEGKLELKEGRPIEEDNGDNDNGPSSDNDEDGIIEGADNEYSNGNELEANGTPEEDDNGNAKGTDKDELKGSKLDKLSYNGNSDDGPKLLAGLDKGSKGEDDNDKDDVAKDCKELPSGAKEEASGAAELLNKGCKELVEDINGSLDEPTLGCDGLDIPEVNKLSGTVNELNTGSTEELANACDDANDGIEGVIDDCTDNPLGNALGNEGKLPDRVKGKLGTAKEGAKGRDDEPKLISPGKDDLASSLRGL